jgi:NADH-quinone oxidoreductase subunit C
MDFSEFIPQKLKEKFPDIHFEVKKYKGELTISFDKKKILEVCRFIKTDPELEFLLCEDITAVDWARRKNRFTVVYHIFSLKNKFRICLEADVDEPEEKSGWNIDSVSSVWKTANWQEREVYDMYGITFNNHPDLRRVYMPEEFEHYPLRKDFPLMGIPGSLPLPKK